MSNDSQKPEEIKLEKELNIAADFAAPSYEEWKTTAEAHLKGVPFEKVLVTGTYEGIDLQPIYRKEDIQDLPHLDEKPGSGNYVRGTSANGYLDKPWEICQALPYKKPGDFNKALIHDLERGQTAINLTIENDEVNAGGNGTAIADLEDLKTALKDIHLEKYPLHINTGYNGKKILDLLTQLLKEKGIDATQINGSLNTDPLAYLATNGYLPANLEDTYKDLAETTSTANKTMPNLKTVGACGLPYQNAGASAVQELAFTLADAVESIDKLMDNGLNIDDIAKNIRFTFGIGPFFFMEIAKIRAARMLWAKIVRAYGGNDESAKMTVHGVTANYNKTVYDPYVNMLRTTTESFSAVVAGVDSLQTNPFDSVIRKPDSFSRRIARNTQIILREESHLDQLIDPAGGSYYVEKLTHQVAENAWKLFQQVQEKGGLFNALSAGFPQTEIKAVADKRKKDLGKRKNVMVGTNNFADVKEVKLEINDNNRIVKPNIDTANAAVTIEPLALHRASEMFEELRDAVNEYQKKTGAKPKLFLATMGPVGQYKARADFSKGFFEVGGFDVIMPDKGFDTPQEAVDAALASGAPAVVICSTDPTYPELVPGITKGIKDANDKIRVILAGYPKEQIEAHKAAGVDEFIFMGADAHGIIFTLLNRIGVVS